MATQNYFKAKNGLEAPSQSTIAVTDSNFPTVRPTLNLDFAGSKSVDSRITFTRASAATYYGADGKIKYAVQNEPRIDYDPVTGECKGLLIEEQRTNLLIASNNLAATNWTYQPNAKLTANAAIAPDGTMSAGLVKSDGSAGVYQSAIIVSSSSPNTKSVWLKGVNGGETVQLKDPSYTVGYVICTLTTSWQRFTLTETQTTGVAGIWISTIPSSGVYIWGPQLELGSFATSYTPSTTTFTSRASSATYFDSTGTLRIASANQARYGYGYDSTSGKWVSQGLILEGAATNLVGLSELPNSAIGDSVSADTGTTGTIAGTWWNFSKHIATTGTSWMAVYQHNGSGGTLNIGTRYVASVYSDSPTSFGIFPSYDAGYIASTSYQVDTNVWRHYVTWVKSTSSPEYVMMHINGTGTRKLAGWQIEAGSFPTSYIPTYGATTTRAADVSSSAATTRSGDIAAIAYSNLTSWYNQSEGTVVATFDMPGVSDSTSAGAVWSLAESYQNRMDLLNNTGWIPDRWHPIVVNNDSWVVDGGQINGYINPTSNAVSNAFAYKQNDFATSWNGGAVATDTSGLVPQPTTLYIGNRLSSSQINGHLKRLTYYSKRLPNAQLTALTA